MTNFICDIMNHWIHQRRITQPQWDPPDEPIMNALAITSHSQQWIGWDQFFHG